jgi:phage terminase large subunit-like protein
LESFQRAIIEELLADGVRTGGLQIPRGNAKSTLCAAIGLWAVCDVEGAPQVPLIAYNGLQANRTLFRPVMQMVALNPALTGRVVTYSASTERRVWSAWNNGELLPLPAEVSRLQGLNPAVALVDEAQTVEPDVMAAVLQGAGKRAESLVLAIGTPAPMAEGSALFDLRKRAADGARVAWIEYAAEAGHPVDDREQWRHANPALEAGILFDDVLVDELATVDEAAFRMYRLGQWIEGAVASWLPLGAWEACPLIEAPPEGVEVVLGLAGTWRSSIALVGSTLDGALFLAWHHETATDDELEDVLSAAWDRWTVAELVVAPRVRPHLVRRLQDGGLPVQVWPNAVDVDVNSSTEWRRAIVEGRVPHDHDPTIGEHVARLVGLATPDGSLRLSAPDDATDVSAARAARIAWTAAVEMAEAPGPAVY